MQDVWAAFCLDSAVSLFGTFVESKLNETDKTGKPRYRLENLLDDAPTSLKDEIMKKGATIQGAFKISRGRSSKKKQE